jgi:hypothetical protein
MGSELGVAYGRRDAGVEGGAEGGADRDGVRRRIGDPFQGLDDDVAFRDWDRKQLGGDTRYYPALVLQRTLARHGGGGSDALEVLGAKPLAYAANEQGYVGTLAPPVSVQLVEDEETQPHAVFHDAPVQIILPGHEQFEHHEVGQEDIRRVVRNAVSLLGVLLARVSGECHRTRARDIADELVELFELRVRQGVHGVDDDGTRAGLAAAALLREDMMNDGDEEAQRLAGARARGDDIALARCG